MQEILKDESDIDSNDQDSILEYSDIVVRLPPPQQFILALARNAMKPLIYVILYLLTVPSSSITLLFLAMIVFSYLYIVLDKKI